jgi:hypothetical protein
MTTLPDEVESPVNRAAVKQALKPGAGQLKINDQLVLHTTSSHLVCDVIVAAHSAWRCQHEFEVLVENARLALQASACNAALPDLPQLWRVMEQQGDAVTELWRQS